MERDDLDDIVNASNYFHTLVPMTLLDASAKSIARQLDSNVNYFREQLAKWVRDGSGWVEAGIDKVYLDYSRYESIRAGTYIKLRPKLVAKRAIINIKQHGQSVPALGNESSALSNTRR